MSHRNVTSWLLIVSPILAMAMWIGVAPDTSDMSPSEELAKLSDNETRAMIGGMLGTLAMVGLLLGQTLLARGLRAPEKPGAICAEIAGLLIVVLIPVMLIGSGYTWAAMSEAGTDKALAEAILINGEGAGAMMGTIWSIGLILLGVALVLQRKFHIAVGYIAIVLAAGILISEIGEDVIGDAADAIQMISWMGMMALSVAIGILGIVLKDD